MEREIILKGTQTLGFSMNDLLATVFGENNVETIKNQAQAAATTVAINQAGQYVQQNPDAIKAITDTGTNTVMDTLARVWQEYKIPVIIGGVLVSGALAYGIYSMIQMNKVTKAIKSNPRKKTKNKKVYQDMEFVEEAMLKYGKKK